MTGQRGRGRTHPDPTCQPPGPGSTSVIRLTSLRSINGSTMAPTAQSPAATNPTRANMRAWTPLTIRTSRTRAMPGGGNRSALKMRGRKQPDPHGNGHREDRSHCGKDADCRDHLGNCFDRVVVDIFLDSREGAFESPHDDDTDCGNNQHQKQSFFCAAGSAR